MWVTDLHRVGWPARQRELKHLTVQARRVQRTGQGRVQVGVFDQLLLGVGDRVWKLSS